MVGDLPGFGERSGAFSDPKQAAGVRARRAIEGCGEGPATAPVRYRSDARRSRTFLIQEIFLTGAGDRFRTDDLVLGKHTLYQLSYTRPVPDCRATG
jgi:hypothetical protein